MITDRSQAKFYGALSIGVLFLAWILSTSIFGLVDPRTLPSPMMVIERFALLITAPFSGSTLFGHALASLTRWGGGVLLAILVGIPTGILFAQAPVFRVVAKPVFELLHYVPPFAWVPIAVLWFGATTFTQQMVVFVAAFPAIVINTQLGVAHVDRILLDAARVFGAGHASTLRRVVIPGAAPSIYTGIRIAISNGWMALVGAELVIGKVGLGFLISQGQQNLSVSTIFVGIISIGVLGVLIDTAIQRSEGILMPWRKGMAGQEGQA